MSITINSTMLPLILAIGKTYSKQYKYECTYNEPYTPQIHLYSSCYTGDRLLIDREGKLYDYQSSGGGRRILVNISDLLNTPQILKNHKRRAEICINVHGNKFNQQAGV